MLRRYGLRTPTKSHTIRFPEPIYFELQAIADKTLYNFNATVIRILENGLAVEKKLMEHRAGTMDNIMRTGTIEDSHEQA